MLTPPEQKDRNHKLSKVIIDHFGQSFFKGKKILDLGAGNGEFAHIFARLGADVTCVDARLSNLQLINKNFPHLKTVQLNLEEQFPFDDFSFDMVFSIDLLCHLKNYQKHLESILRVSEKIVLETEILDSSNPDLLVPIFESKDLDFHSFVGEGSLVSEQNIQNKLASFNAKFKRIDETKLNTAYFRYDWRQANIGRKAGYRRLWVIRRDVHLVRKLQASQEVKNAQVEYSARFINSTRKTQTMRGAPVIASNTREIEKPPEIHILGQQKYYRSILTKEKRFVIVIPSYNNQRWCEKNIFSALNQDYGNFRIIFTDDCSSDETYKLVSAAVEASPNKHRCTIIRNQTRVGALANLYNMIHSCADDEIVLTLDGDDWFPHNNVLNKLREHYKSGDIWMTYGQYTNSTDGAYGVAARYSDSVIATNTFRKAPWGASHLRTFYSWLFKKIKKEDLYYQGSFMMMTWDLGMMIPMLEMAGPHSKFIPDILYVYNMENILNDHKVNGKLQQALDKYVRTLPKYARTTVPVRKTKVGLVVLATNKYDRYIQQLITSADKYFLEHYDVSYYLFTDSNIEVKSNRKIYRIPITHKPFPFASLDRFLHINNNSSQLQNEDFIYYVDVDCTFVSQVGNEIIGDRVGVSHCGFHKKEGPWETNPKSTLYINPLGPRKYKAYFGGGFFGANLEEFLKLSRWCQDAADRDIANDVMPVHHDESILNRYFLDNEPTIILNPSYHFPQSNKNHYQKIWGNETFQPVIILLDKDHAEIRKND